MCIGVCVCVIMLTLPLQVAPRMDMTLAELQEMAARQQQQIDSQQQLLASKVWEGGRGDLKRQN